MRTSTINRLITTLADAFAALGKDVPLAEAERLAIQIHRAMDSPRRAYHTSRHVLDVCAGGSPLAVLAALYHDVVYIQLDGGFPAEMQDFLGAYIRQAGEHFELHLPATADLPTRLCALVFGHADGAALRPLAGLNEFASALVAARCLARWLSPPELLGVIACIEATIPFRGPDAAGRTVGAALRERLADAAERCGIELAPGQLETQVADALAMADRDVAGFAEADPAVFLANTWLLIEESNAALVAVGVYTVQDYRRALARMEGFLSILDPGSLFHGPAPAGAAGDPRLQAARHNIEFARRYLAGKLVAVAIVEALALETGGDCPVSMLLGDIAQGPAAPLRIEDLLPAIDDHPDVDAALLAVFDQGRRAPSLRDLTHSPLTAYVYRHLGEHAMLATFARARAMFAGTLAPHAFLDALPAALRAAIIAGCADIACSRRAQLLALYDPLLSSARSG